MRVFIVIIIIIIIIIILTIIIIVIIIIITVMRHFYNHICVVTQPTLKVLSRCNRHNMRCLR